MLLFDNKLVTSSRSRTFEVGRCHPHASGCTRHVGRENSLIGTVAKKIVVPFLVSERK
jgi:hypothetical protein